jgi:hypothetical protein
MVHAGVDDLGKGGHELVRNIFPMNSTIIQSYLSFALFLISIFAVKFL